MSPRLASTLLIMTALTGAGRGAETPPHDWQLLAPLPNSIGWGGMFAGVLNDRLVTGGGSQFHDKPNWLQGEKVYSDRIFVLDDPAGRWTEHATKLPVKMGHFATVAASDAIYLIGGINQTGCLAKAWRIDADGDQLRFTALPDFPHPIGYGAAAIAHGRIYVFGGLTEPASKTPNVETWSLALAESPSRTWRREPDWPSPGLFVCAGASDGESIYAFGGIGFDATGKAIPSARALRLAPDAKAWDQLADLPGPRVGPSTPCPLIEGKKFFVIGGYAEVFPGAPRDHPGFSTQTLIYEAKHNAWSNGPVLPHATVANRDQPGDPGPAPMIGAPCVVWRDRVITISGEVRASVRSPQVLAWPLAAKTP